MKYSIRTLLMAVALFAAMMVAAGWYGKLPPSAHGQWTRESTEFSTDETSVLHQYFLGNFSANNVSFAGFITRDSAFETPYNLDWVQCDDGCLFVNGKRIMPKSGYQLFVADGNELPKLVILDSADLRLFLSFKLRNLDEIPEFWSGLNALNRAIAR